MRFPACAVNRVHFSSGQIYEQQSKVCLLGHFMVLVLKHLEGAESYVCLFEHGSVSGTSIIGTDGQ